MLRAMFRKNTQPRSKRSDNPPINPNNHQYHETHLIRDQLFFVPLECRDAPQKFCFIRNFGIVSPYLPPSIAYSAAFLAGAVAMAAFDVLREDDSGAAHFAGSFAGGAGH